MKAEVLTKCLYISKKEVVDKDLYGMIWKTLGHQPLTHWQLGQLWLKLDPQNKGLEVVYRYGTSLCDETTELA